jgi:hypothetical protein
MEEGEVGSLTKANRLSAIFAGSFHSISITIHPRGIPGESQGKSSNLKWAANKAVEMYGAKSTIHDVVVTVMDGT